MTRVQDLAYTHPVVVFDGGDHWSWVEARATAPVTAAGISGFIRYRDAVTTRYGYLVTSWETEKDGVPYVGVRVYGLDDAAAGEPPRPHPSADGRFRQLAEACATTDTDAARRLSVAQPPPRPLLWARRTAGELVVPVTVRAGIGFEHVSLRSGGPLPVDTPLLLTREGAAEEIARSAVPVAVPVYPYTHRTREKVAARVAAGRAEPSTVLTIGTLEQFEEGSGR